MYPIRTQTSVTPSGYLDTNLMSGLVKEDLGPVELPALRELLRRRKAGEIILCTSHEASEELGRIPAAARARHEDIYMLIDDVPTVSNDIANLYTEKATLSGHAPGFHVKDKLENKLHDIVCDGTMTLRSVQQQIAANWQTLYKRVYGIAP